jgi:putative ABC transport system permease protein
MSSSDPNPPRFLEWILARLSLKLERDALVDDLAEEFAETSQRRGRAFTALWYGWQVLRAVPATLVYSIFRSLVMAKNYGVIALRNLRRNKVFSFLNISGLAIGLCLCLIVVRLVIAMYASDRFHENRDLIYRVIGTEVAEGRTFDLAVCPMPMAYELEQMPGVESIVRVKKNFGGPTVVGEKKFMTRGYYADAEFFRMFSYALEAGDPDVALAEPYSVVLTKKLALKLFGSRDPLGEMVGFKDFGEFKVTGVMEDTSRLRSHMEFECLASVATLESLESQGKVKPSLRNWKGLNDNYLYLMLQPSARPKAVGALLPGIAEKHYPIDGLEFTFKLQALTEISPGRNLVNALGPTTSPEEPFFLSLIAFVIILIACFNYTNLSLAKALSRAKEVGIRKVIGANRLKLFTQFIGEAVTYALISLGFAFLLVELVAPLLYSELRLYFDVEGQGLILAAALLVVAVVTGILAGFLPALYLSKFDPALVLKDITKVRLFSRMTLRKALVVTQFFISFFFVFTTVVLFRQVRFERDADMGFNPENILNVELQKVDYENFRQEILGQAAITSVSASAFLPNSGTRWPSRVKLDGIPEPFEVDLVPADENFIPDLEIEIVAGRNFSENARLQQEKYVILNETAARIFGFEFPADALGQVVEFDEEVSLEVIGVVEDFVSHLVSAPLRPLAVRMIPKHYRFANLKLATSDRESVVAFLEEKWKGLEPFRPLAYAFFTDRLNDAFTQSREILQTVSIVAFMTIFIAFFGLLGMVIYDTDARIKEIGIRKVMGASSFALVGLISKRFIYLLAFAAALASPLAWFVNNNLFLQNMAHRITLGFDIFLVGLGAMFVLGLLIIFSQTIRAAHRNPVESLRYE